MFPSKNYIISILFEQKEQKLCDLIKGSKIKIIFLTKTVFWNKKQKKTNKMEIITKQVTKEKENVSQSVITLKYRYSRSRG